MLKYLNPRDSCLILLSSPGNAKQNWKIFSLCKITLWISIDILVYYRKNCIICTMQTLGGAQSPVKVEVHTEPVKSLYLFLIHFSFLFNVQILCYRVENAQQKSAIEAKDKDADEKMKTINQLRKIGRKYRMQAEEAVKNLETLKEEVEKGSGGKIAALEEKIKTIEKDLELITEKLGSSVVEKNEALQMAKDSENTVKGLREQLSKSTEVSRL